MHPVISAVLLLGVAFVIEASPEPLTAEQQHRLLSFINEERAFVNSTTSSYMIINSRASGVGCALNQCEGRDLMLCLFDAGPIAGQDAFTSGERCSACTVEDADVDCEAGVNLCPNPDCEPAFTTTTSTTTSSTTTSTTSTSSTTTSSPSVSMSTTTESATSTAEMVRSEKEDDDNFSINIWTNGKDRSVHQMMTFPLVITSSIISLKY